MDKKAYSFPLSSAQERLWVLSQINNNNSVYNVPIAVELIGNLDIDILFKSIQHIVDRHEILRTSFKVLDNTPRQLVNPKIKLSFQELVDYYEIEFSGEVQSWINDASRHQINLSTCPVFDIKLLKLEKEHSLLFINFHHIIIDEWSVGVFFRELKLLYEAYVSGKEAPLEELPIQYGDYAVWQREWLQGDVLEKLAGYWKKKLEGLQDLDLPTDRPRSAEQTFKGATYTIQLDRELSMKLKELARAEGVTLNMLTLTAFNVLLYRYTQQEDIAVGIPIANRNRMELEGLIGFFLNTLVARTDLSGEPTFSELLKRVKETLLEAYEHQDLPFEKLVAVMNPERDLSRTPLFQVMFITTEEEMGVEQIGNIDVSRLNVETSTSKFDLTMFVGENGDQLKVSLEYSTDLFDRDRIERMAGHYRRLFEDIVEYSEKKIWELELLTEEEKHQILIEWNDTKIDHPKDNCVHQLIEDQAERTPDAVAVVFGEQQLTYRELNERANQLGHYLQKLGVGTEVLVGIYVERSLEMIVGLLGILKAGGAYVPLDPSYPHERVAYMVEDTNLRVLLTQSSIGASLATEGRQMVYLDQEWGEIEKESTKNVDSKVQSENLVYVIYTSGSTGKPKGVMITHGGVVNVLKSFQLELNVNSEDILVFVTTLSFDIAALEIFMPLASGFVVCIATRNEARDGEQLETLLTTSRATLMQATPTTWRLLLNTGWTPPPFFKALCGGEALSMELARQLCARGVQLWNVYGPTETTIWSTMQHVNASILDKVNNSIPIGRSIGNTQVYIFDRYNHLVPSGVVGEIYIGGDGLARGYLNHLDLTDKKFVKTPCHKKNSLKLYKTGDLARWLSDGTVEFLGRVDNQVKIRGYRMELGEIESVLESFPAIKEAVVIVKEDELRDKHLVAYFIAKNEQPTALELKHFISKALPIYMVPSIFIAVDSFPLTENGKVDRKTLSKLWMPHKQLNKHFISPESPVQKMLCNIWEEVLKVENIGIQDNFFDLGGDSLLSMQIILKAKKTGVNLSAGAIFKYPTIEELSKHLKSEAVVRKLTYQKSEKIPLMPSQLHYFKSCLQNQVDPEIDWLIKLVLKTSTPLIPEILEKALRKLLEYHDALNLKFIKTNMGWEQIFDNLESTVEFSKIDLSGLSNLIRERTFKEVATQSQIGLNLSEGPLIRMVYFSYGDEQQDQILVVIHHLIADGISLPIIIEDLEIIYKALAEDKLVDIPSSITSYKEYSVQLTEYASSLELKKEADFWLSNVSGGVNTNIPIDFPYNVGSIESVRSMTSSLNRVESDILLRKVPQKYSVRIDAVLLTALLLTFEKWTGDRHLYVRLAGHGREEIVPNIDVIRTVGPFAISFPLQLTVELTKNILETLQIVNTRLVSVPKKGIGFGALRYLSGISHTNNNLIPEPMISFNYQGHAEHNEESYKFLERDFQTKIPKIPYKGKWDRIFGIRCSFTDGIFVSNWSYSQNLHKSDTIDYLTDTYFKFIRSLLA